MDNTANLTRVALVTGGAHGVGRQIVVAFARAGYNVAFTYNSDEDGAQVTERQTRALGAKCICIKTDVTNEVDIAATIDAVLNHCERIDVLINSAGINEDGLLKNMGTDTWKRVIDVNLTGAFLCMRAVVGTMERQKYGRIINIGSVVGDTGTIGASNYAASKAGLVGLTRAFAREVAKKGITANVVALGYLDKGMGSRLPEKIANKVIEQIPMGKFGDTEKIAQVIVHLASAEAEYMTGQVIGINGGLHM